MHKVILPFSCFTARSHLVDSPPTYNADYNYKSWEAYSNLSYYTRTLAPLSQNCPSPDLPNAKQVVEKVLLRKQFIPDPQRSSLMFAFFAQHFTHQFFKSDFKKGPAFTKALGHGVSGIQSSVINHFTYHPKCIWNYNAISKGSVMF